MNKTVKAYECCDATFYGIHKWYKAMFEELGWMILAKTRGMLDKTSTYKNSLGRLKQAIVKKHASVHDKDKKDDLKYMLDNVDILIEHANRDL
jgi:SMC interacting uncharacterized protein involved in chromosome segregation